jgi:myo-inositol-1(or 4)-monophosphatase
LQSARPAYGWLSEETPDNPERLSAEALWITDPIDGTRSFLNGTDEWCVAVALAIHGRPVFGAVHRPVTEQFYEASLGGGARLNGRSLRLVGRTELDGAKIAGSSGALKKLATHGAIEHHAKTSVPLALRLCFVASGNYDAALSTGNKNDWDLAAGDLIVHEAGGKVTGLDGRRYAFNRRNTWQQGLVAGSAPLHEKIIAVMGTRHDEESS